MPVLLIADGELPGEACAEMAAKMTPSHLTGHWPPALPLTAGPGVHLR